MVRLRCERYPQLAVRSQGKRWRFNGGVLDVDDPAVARELAARPYIDSDEPVSDAPKATASKAAWVDYAVSQGVDREDAEASTKAELIEALDAR